MTTSLAPSLSEIETGEKIPAGTLAAFRERLRIKMHQAVLREFAYRERTSGLTRKALAERIGRRPEQITRWLGAPANLTVDTLSDLMIGMGVEPVIGARPIIEAHQAPAQYRPVRFDLLTVARTPMAAASSTPVRIDATCADLNTFYHDYRYQRAIMLGSSSMPTVPVVRAAPARRPPPPIQLPNSLGSQELQ